MRREPRGPDHDTMSRWINRAAFVVRPRQPYLDWAASQDAEAPAHFEGLKERVSIYLVAEDPKEEEETAPLTDYYERIFETELEAWTTDEEHWPKPRSFEMFRAWFEVTGQSIVTDLESSPVRAEKK